MTENYDYTRENLYSLIKKGQEAIDEVKKLAEDSDIIENYPDKLFEIGKNFMEEYSPALQELADIERQELSANVETPENTDKPFYRYFAIDYFATGEGRSFWLTICRNYQRVDDRDREKERFVKFIGVGADHYMHGFEELIEDEFLDKYGKLVPDYVIEMIARKDQPAFLWETHLYFNYS